MSDSQPLLFGYWRSTAAYRVRIALNLKGVAYAQRSVHLVRDGGEQHQAEFLALNPAGLVPALQWGETLLSQSLAICEFLEEQVPEPALLPAAPEERAMVRAMAMDIACDMHPLNNLRVQQYLSRELGAGPESLSRWMAHWMALGFASVEGRLQSLGSRTGQGFALGDQPGLADLCLVAQAYNADRFEISLEAYPRVLEIIQHCRRIPAFAAAAPEQQPDAQPV